MEVQDVKLLNIGDIFHHNGRGRGTSPFLGIIVGDSGGYYDIKWRFTKRQNHNEWTIGFCSNSDMEGWLYNDNLTFLSEKHL